MVDDIGVHPQGTVGAQAHHDHSDSARYQFAGGIDHGPQGGKFSAGQFGKLLPVGFDQPGFGRHGGGQRGPRRVDGDPAGVPGDHPREERLVRARRQAAAQNHGAGCPVHGFPEPFHLVGGQLGPGFVHLGGDPRGIDDGYVRPCGPRDGDGVEGNPGVL